MNSIKEYQEMFETDCEWEKFRGKTFLITGATGLIGSHIIKALCVLNKEFSAEDKIRIIAVARDEKKFLSILDEYTEETDIKFISNNIVNPLDIDEDVHYIIHGASVTSSMEFVKKPVETLNTTFQGTKNMLELGAKKNLLSFVYLSSLEVYGQVDNDLEKINEKNYGYIDFLNVRSSYSEGKRVAECLCTSYAKEYNVPVCIARLSQTFGPGVSYNDGRIFAEFSRAVIEHRNIVLHTKGDTERSYCYVIDAVDAILRLLLRGQVGEAYNIANKDTYISIRDMAVLVSKRYSNSNTKVVYELSENEKYGYNPTVKINLDTEKIEKIGWKPKANLEKMCDNLIDDMKKRDYHEED
ncbi:NAD-dependent epimerase/dehydratase family protein [Anaerosporobacter sp.]